MEIIDEHEASPKTPDENKSIANQKATEYPTDMSDTTESEANVQGRKSLIRNSLNSLLKFFYP